jgi:rhomboid protease GluP
LANCRQCGTELPSFSFGEASPYCKTCGSQLPSEPKREAINALPEQAITAIQPPLATYILFAINIAVFLAMVASGISWINPAPDRVLQWGADYGPYTLNGQYWRLITSMFLHFGIIHIAGNMWCLWSLGRLAEKLLGSLTLFCVYLLTGIGASLLSLSWDPMRVSAGASGAIFGIAGVLITTLYFGKHNLQKEAVRRLLGYVVRFSLLNLLFGLQGHIDNMAHAGGLVSGLLIGFFLARTFSSPAGERSAQRRMILGISALVLLVLFVPVVKAKQYAVEFDKGQIAFNQQNYKAAIEHMQRYTSERPNDEYGHALLGASFQGEGRADDAVREYERGLAINPGNRYVQINLAELYVFQGKAEKALPFFRKNMQEVSSDAQAMSAYGNALKQTGDLAQAEDALRKSIQLDGKSVAAHELLFEVLKEEGKTEEANQEQHTVGLLLQTNKSSSNGSDAKSH